MPREEDITIDAFSPGERFLSYVDWHEGNHSGTIDSQNEVTKAAELFYESNWPQAQIYFQEWLTQKIEWNHFKVPLRFAEFFEKQLEVYQEQQSRNDDLFQLGRVPVFVKYQLDLAAITQKFSPDWYVSTTTEGQQTLFDEKGAVVLVLEKNPNEQVTGMSSPLAPLELRHALLWMPPVFQQDIVALLGLPDLEIEEVQNYARHRMQWEDQFPIPQETIPKTSPWTFMKYDADCHRNSWGFRWKSPQNIREAILSQCSRDKMQIRFPAFGVTSAQNEDPILRTEGQYTCLVVIIYDKRTTKSVMAHLLTSDRGDTSTYTLEQKHDLACVYPESAQSYTHYITNAEIAQLLGGWYNWDRRDQSEHCNREQFPYEWYASVFRRDTFKNSNEEDLEVTLLYVNTPLEAIDDAAQVFKYYFPHAMIRKAYADETRATSWLDSRDGTIYVASYFTAEKYFKKENQLTHFTVLQNHCPPLKVQPKHVGIDGLRHEHLFHKQFANYKISIDL